MRYTTWMVATAVLFAIHGTGRAAQEERIELKWNEVAQAVAGRTVQMVLPDGTSLKGPVLNVTSEALEIQIKKTSNRQTYPKGQISIPRSSVSVLRYTQVRGRWRAIGTAIGAGASAVVGSLVYTRFNNEANPETGATLAAGIVGAGAAAGYFAGRGADKRVTIITIVREEASADHGEP